MIAEHAQADKQPEIELERQKKRQRCFQLQVEWLTEFLQDREPKRGSDGKEIQSNVIDNESVKMPTSHGVLQGYNALQKRMNRFTVRTKLKVDVQWTRTRFALVHNIGKIHTFGAIQ